MNKVQFQGYCIDFDASQYDTQGLPPGIKLSHTFVSSPNYDFNCFGQGKQFVSTAKMLPSAAGSALEEWAIAIYGPNHDEYSPAADVLVRQNGVCHNAANRVLAIAGADVSDATGNALVMLMYGKYGFGVKDYIQKIKDAADKVNADAKEIVITPDDVNTVLNRVLGDASLELPTLERDLLRTHFAEQVNQQNFTADELASLQKIYSDFEVQREQVFTTQAVNPGTASLQGRYAGAMKPVLLGCLQQMLQALGETKYLSMFEANPSTAVEFLLGV